MRAGFEVGDEKTPLEQKGYIMRVAFSKGDLGDER